MWHDLAQNAIEWAVLGVVGFSARAIVDYLGQIKNSIVELNQNVAIILEKIDEHDRRIELLEDRKK